MNKKKYIIIGLVVTFAIAVLIWGINYLKGDDIFKKERLYYVPYSKVNGLTVSSPVLVSGFKVGQVRDIHFSPRKRDELIVVLAVSTKFDFPKDTRAFLFSADLMGTKAIELKLGNGDSFHNDGDTLQGDIETELVEQVSREMTPIKLKAEKLMNTTDSVLMVVRSVLDDKTKNNLHVSIDRLRMVMNNLQSITKNLDTIMNSEKAKISSTLTNLKSFSSNLKDNNEKISTIIGNLNSFSDSLQHSEIKKTMMIAQRTMKDLNDITAKINSGKGSIGQFLHNDTLYTNLENVTYNLNKLVRDMRESPKKYVHFSLFDIGRNIYVSDEELEKKNAKDKKKP